MTEDELDKLSAAERAKLPEEVLYTVGLTTRDEGRAILEMEGWTYFGIDTRFGESPAEEEVELWTRTVGGVTEWCELFNCGYPAHLPEDLLPEDAQWARLTSPFDPRLIDH